MGKLCIGRLKKRSLRRERGRLCAGEKRGLQERQQSDVERERGLRGQMEGWQYGNGGRTLSCRRESMASSEQVVSIPQLQWSSCGVLNGEKTPRVDHLFQPLEAAGGLLTVESRAILNRPCALHVHWKWQKTFSWLVSAFLRRCTLEFQKACLCFSVHILTDTHVLLSWKRPTVGHTEDISSLFQQPAAEVWKELGPNATRSVTSTLC